MFVSLRFKDAVEDPGDKTGKLPTWTDETQFKASRLLFTLSFEKRDRRCALNNQKFYRLPLNS